MIEDEAKTKWCPFSRVVGGERDWPPHNRRSLDSDQAAGIPVTCLCIASACMAWRTEGYREVHAGASKAGGGGPSTPIFEKRPGRPGHGFCGLAGAPQ